MVKPKQRNVRRIPGKKQQNQVFPETELPDEEDWMVVKKQKITILIPPLPSKVQPAVHSIGEGQLQETPRETKSNSPGKTNSEGQLPSVASASTEPGHESAKSVPLSPELAIHPTTLHVNPTFRKSSSLCNRMASDNSPLPSFGEQNGIGKCSTSKCNKGIMLFADGSKFLNQRMRASYLEKKLKRAGGLENWLISLGLTCFVKVFKMRRVNKFQLANLTMEKLKAMGTNAVGPRRKLMHAIDCVCVPHCFQHM